MRHLRRLGATGPVRSSVPYLRISALGAPAYLVALADAGFLRGVQDTRTTFVIALCANILNLLLEVFLVYGLDRGISGSAWGTVLAQIAAAAAYVAITLRSARDTNANPRPRRAGVRAVAVVGGPLIVRTASLLAVFLAVTALATRVGDTAVAAHQIGFQLNLLLALTLDALAIAAQALVGRFLGAGSAMDARGASNRMIEFGIVLGFVLGVAVATASPWFPRVFTTDDAVRHLATQVLLIVAAFQPLAAVVFVLDGVLIGAGDQRYLAAAMLVATVGIFAPLALLIASLGGGLIALWGALAAWLLARAVGVGARYLGSGWEITGGVRVR